MKKCLLLLFFMGANASAQSCLPKPFNNEDWEGTEAFISYNSVGSCIQWYCFANRYENVTTIPIHRVTYCGTWSQMHLVGSRIQTIQKAPDPLKSLKDLPYRIKVVPLTDPSMKGMPK